MEQMLDAENKRMTENLSSKVSRLKSLALDIDKDTEDQNRYLDGMDQGHHEEDAVLLTLHQAPAGAEGRDQLYPLMGGACSAGGGGVPRLDNTSPPPPPAPQG
ncbi:BET1-like protein isoform X3 [Latimeria chalumnae]